MTLYLWNPTLSKTAITRMTGHQKGVNYVSFSPDGRLIASGSFDKVFFGACRQAQANSLPPR